MIFAFAQPAILRVLDAVKAGRTPEDPEATRSVVEEVRAAAAGTLVKALKSLRMAT